MPVNEPDDAVVALSKLHAGNCGGAFEAGKTEIHRSTLSDAKQKE